LGPSFSSTDVSLAGLIFCRRGLKEGGYTGAVVMRRYFLAKRGLDVEALEREGGQHPIRRRQY
jgi:hypothetical protein